MAVFDGLLMGFTAMGIHLCLTSPPPTTGTLDICVGSTGFGRPRNWCGVDLGGAMLNRIGQAVRSESFGPRFSPDGKPNRNVGRDQWRTDAGLGAGPGPWDVSRD